MNPTIKIIIYQSILLAFSIIRCDGQEKNICIDSRDGKTYKTIKIGCQVWMSSNLSYIPNVFPLYTNMGIYVYNYYGFDVETAIKTKEYRIFGCLYNWKVANTICPNGWHLPTDKEWKQLEEKLGMSPSEADSVNWRRSGRVDQKIMSHSEWVNDTGNNNESGFSALPGGISFSNDYMKDTIFGLMLESAQFWTSTLVDEKKAWARGIYIGSPGFGRAPISVGNGLSVRCIKD
jgi:uncharacterized protein (TIGR02145 family)